MTASPVRAILCVSSRTLVAGLAIHADVAWNVKQQRDRLADGEISEAEPQENATKSWPLYNRLRVPSETGKQIADFDYPHQQNCRSRQPGD